MYVGLSRRGVNHPPLGEPSEQYCVTRLPPALVVLDIGTSQVHEDIIEATELPPPIAPRASLDEGDLGSGRTINGTPSARSRSASRSFRTIWSGVCLARFTSTTSCPKPGALWLIGGGPIHGLQVRCCLALKPSAGQDAVGGVTGWPDALAAASSAKA